MVSPAALLTQLGIAGRVLSRCGGAGSATAAAGESALRLAFCLLPDSVAKRKKMVASSSVGAGLGGYSFRLGAARDSVINAPEARRFFNRKVSTNHLPDIYECTTPRVCIFKDHYSRIVASARARSLKPHRLLHHCLCPKIDTKLCNFHAIEIIKLSIILVGVILEVARLLKVGQANKKCIFLVEEFI